MRLAFTFFLFLSVACCLAAQPLEVPAYTPSPHDAEAGANIFHSHCAECHGPKGEGGRGPDLTRGGLRYGATDAALYRTIAYGIAGSQMPATYFPANQIWQVVAFVKSLSSHDTGVPVPGNAEAGAKSFQRIGCAQCHMIRGEGGHLGPDLTDIGAIRSPSYLRAAILDPNAKPLDRYRATRLIDKNGKEISGVLLDEDTYSIQIMDYQEHLRSLLKRDLREAQVLRKSAMPSFADKISSGDLDDLTSYLCSLKTAR